MQLPGRTTARRDAGPDSVRPGVRLFYDPDLRRPVNPAASHRLALEQLDAARLAASALSGHAAALEAGVTGPEGRVAMLREAWGEVYAALDRVDAQKAQALRAIAQADRELTRPK